VPAIEELGIQLHALAVKGDGFFDLPDCKMTIGLIKK
jgi:hypothetical protein